MSGLLFITAPEADHKLINRLLLHLRDWQHESGDRFKLVISKSIQALGEELHDNGRSATAPMRPTFPSVSPDLVNEWAGASTADVEAFCLALDASGTKGLNTHLFVALDAEGVADRRCVLAQRVIDWEAEPIRFPEVFDKARVPWTEAYLMWTNLDVSHVGWDEMMLEDAGEVDDGGWWTFDAEDDEEYLPEEKCRLRDEAVSRLEGEGRA